MAQKAKEKNPTFKASTDRLTLGTFLVNSRKYNFDPPYQREGGVWSDDKKRFFIDSLVNKYDTPKIYLYDTEEDEDNEFDFHVIDGKQRLTTILDFKRGKLSLENSEESGITAFRKEAEEFAKKDRWDDLSEEAQEYFKALTLDAVYITSADGDGIEDQFSRLNNGESLNNAEKRNAIGGDMNEVIKLVANHPFIKSTCNIKIKRYSDRELVAKFLTIEVNDRAGRELACDLKKKNLDELVKDNKHMSDSEKTALRNEAKKCLDYMDKIFSKQQHLLNRVTHIPTYYVFIKHVKSRYGHQKLDLKLQEFFPKFLEMRENNNQKNENDRDRDLERYREALLQGTSNKEKMSTRLSILISHFLRLNPDVKIKDAKRNFGEHERQALFAFAGEKCQGCGVDLRYSDMHADHIEPHALGGETKFENAQCLCQQCNQEKGKKLEDRQ